MPRPDADPTASTIADELRVAGERKSALTQAAKKNYAEKLSRLLAARFANELRQNFIGILPDASGLGQESRARSSKGFKKLDVNYSTVELGLGLGVSLKTINFPDPRTKRYTKNYTRVDGELRAEASDYHERQPYAVMIAIVFLPLDSCDDGSTAPSSFGQAVQIFRFRSGRSDPSGPPVLFERVFIGLYEAAEGPQFGDVIFFDVASPPPRNGRPKSSMSFSEVVQAIIDTYDRRNSPRFEWADAEPEKVTSPPVEEDEEEA